MAFTVSTDQLDYAPGSTATFTASGVTGGSVQFVVQALNAGDDGVYFTSDDVVNSDTTSLLGTTTWEVVDGGVGDLDGLVNGQVTTSWYVDPDATDQFLRLTARDAGADGSLSTDDDVVATTNFTDSNGDFSIDFIAAAPGSYNHLTGGGAYDDRTIGKNADAVESLEGADFACGDIVTYFVVVTVDDTDQADLDGPQTIELDFSFLADTTGQSGVAIGDIVYVAVNYGEIEDLIAGENTVDDGIDDDGGSVATLVNEHLVGTLFQPGAVLYGTVILDDLERGEQVVVRIDVKLFCDPGSNPTGNLQADLQGARLTFINDDDPVTPAEAIPGGAQTVPFKQVGDIGVPELDIQKTVRLADTADPFVESLTIDSGDTVEYKYVVANSGEAPLYNVVVVDDAGTPGILGDDFSVTLVSGLTDIDGDFLADDLAAGATAFGYYEVALVGSTTGSTTIVNTATATGVDSIILPTELTDTDTATVLIPFVPDPDISLVKDAKLVDDGDNVLTAVLDYIEYKFTVTNTGNVALTGVYVTETAFDLESGGLPNDIPDQFVGNLAVGQQVVVTYNYYLTQEDIDKIYADKQLFDDEVENTAEAIGFYGDTQVVAEDDASVLIPDAAVNPLLSIIKTGAWVDGDADGYADEGEAINYTFDVTNEGNVTLTNVMVTDDVYGVIISGGPTTLDVGETDSTTFTGVYYITQDDIDAGHFFNVALADSDESEPDDDDEDVLLPQNPAFKVEKQFTSVDGGDFDEETGEWTVDSAGDIINYSIVVTNTGNQTLTGVQVSDPFAMLVGPVETGGTGDNNNGLLDVGEVWTYTATHVVTQAEMDGGVTAVNAILPTSGVSKMLSNPSAGSLSYWGVQIGDNTLNNGNDTVFDGLYNAWCADNDRDIGPGSFFNSMFYSTYELDDLPVLVLPPTPFIEQIVDKPENLDLVNWIINQDFVGQASPDGLITYGDVQRAIWGLLEDEQSTAGLAGSGWTVDKANYIIDLAQLNGEGFVPGFGQDVAILVVPTSSAGIEQSVLIEYRMGENLCNTVWVDTAQTTPPQSATDCTAVTRLVAIDVEKYVVVNGVDVDADSPTGPQILYAHDGQLVQFKFVVTNTGNVTLYNVALTDDDGKDGLDIEPILLSGPELQDLDGDGEVDDLAPGDSVTAYLTRPWEDGQHVNKAEATGEGPQGQDVSDCDLAHYFGVEGPGVRTPGFWGQKTWQDFWDGDTSVPKQAGQTNFPDSDLLLPPYYEVPMASLLIGDYNRNGATDPGEETIALSLADAVKILNASQKDSQDTQFVLGRDVVATWLNFLAGNPIEGDDSNTSMGGHQDVKFYLDEAIDWLKEFTTNHSGNPIGNGTVAAGGGSVWNVNTNGDGGAFNPETESDILAGNYIHQQLDEYNNTGAIDGTVYAWDGDNGNFFMMP